MTLNQRELKKKNAICILFLCNVHTILNEIYFSHVFPFLLVALGAEKELGGSASWISVSFGRNRHHTQEVA